MQNSPDSALNIMSTIDRGAIKHKRLNAEYALLYSIALDKNYIMVESDSLIRVARDFYSHSKDVRNRFLANYYYGCVLFNRNEKERALVNFLRIEPECKALGDAYLLGLLYHQICEIFASQYDYPNSLKFANLAYVNYLHADKTYHCGYALYNIGDAYENLERPDSAIVYYLRSLEISRMMGDSAMMRTTLGSLALSYIENGDPHKAVSALQDIREELHVNWNNWEHTVMANTFQIMNRLDSALYYLHRAQNETPSDPLSQAQVGIAAAKIHMKTGEYKKAAKEYEYCLHIQDSLARIALRQSYANVHRDFIDKQRRATDKRLRATRQRLWLSISSGLILLLFIGYVAYINYRKWQATIARYIMAIEEIRRTRQIMLLKLESQKRDGTKELQRLIKDRFAIIDELATTYYERRGANEQKAIFNKVKTLLENYASDKKSKQEIEDAVNMCYDNVMLKVRRELPMLKDYEFDLLLYVYAGFALRVISIFTGDSINYTAVKKSRLKSKIQESNAPSKELFISLM